MSPRSARAARGAAIAGFATFAAALAHTVGGGTPPGLLAILLALAFSAPLAMVLAGGRARLLRTMISTLVAQTSLHLCYAVVGGAGFAGRADATAPSGHVGHASQAGRTADALSSPLADGLASTGYVDHGHEFMPLTHAVAAALTLLALVAGDRVVRALGRTVRLFLRRLTSIPAAVVAVSPRLTATGERPTLIAHLPHAALSSRGPPVVAVVS